MNRNRVNFTLLRILLIMIPVLSHHDVFTEIKGSYHFGTEDGLPSNHVLCMYVDREGAVWVGTSGGAARYDG